MLFIDINKNRYYCRGSVPVLFFRMPRCVFP